MNDINTYHRIIDKLFNCFIEAVRKTQILHFIFDVFGERDVEVTYEGHGNFSEIRGWHFMGNWIPYDDDFYYASFPSLDIKDRASSWFNEFMMPVTGIRCNGFDYYCYSRNANRYRQNTSYSDDRNNFVTLCPKCRAANDEFLKGEWADYWSDRL